MKIHGRPQFEAFTAAELAERKVVGPLFRLLVDFRIEVDGLGEIVIPAGFETDWASIPGFARAYLSGDDPRILVPSLAHDWLYNQAGCFNVLEKPLDRQQCDDVLRRLMVFCGASNPRAYTVYLAVRAGGGSHWPKNHGVLAA